MRTGKAVEVVPRAAGSGTRDSVWTLRAPSAPSRSSPGLAPAASAELAELAWASVQVRTALEEMTVATQAAVAGARAIVAVMDAAVAVLGGAERADPAEMLAQHPAGARSVLSPREREVLALVAEGRSNKAIAAELFLSPNTIKTHVASLMNKLQAESRVQLAAIAARQEAALTTAPNREALDTLAS